MGIERWLGVAAGLTVGLYVLYYMYGPRIQEELTEPKEPPAAEAPPPAPEPAPVERAAAPQYPPPPPPVNVDTAPAKPVPNAAAPTPPREPEPDIAASDGTVREALAQVFGDDPVEAFLIPERVIQNIVATVDSLDREPVPMRFRAVQSVPELPVVETYGDSITLSAANAERYSVVVAALEQTDAQHIAGVYLRYYPLFDRAYRELGYPKGHFNDRLVQVIDHLLATPEIQGPIRLVRPKVLYRFADPALEQRSSGQKALIRMGPDNAAVVKEKLAEIRRVITSNQAATSAPPAG
jgi:hypothetical protein